MKTRTLEEWARMDEPTKGGVALSLRASAASPVVLDKLRHIDRLGLPLDEVVLSLLAQAPIDPLGIFGALRGLGSWAFQAFDCTALHVLARDGKEIQAAMRLDLLSDDIAFLAVRPGGQLETVHALPADVMEGWLREPGMTEDIILGRVRAFMERAVTIARLG